MAYPIFPAYQFKAVTPSDTVALSYDGTNDKKCRGLYVGVSGDVVCLNDEGNAITFTGLASGIIHPIATTRVNATSTTATNIVACY